MQAIRNPDNTIDLKGLSIEQVDEIHLSVQYLSLFSSADLNEMLRAIKPLSPIAASQRLSNGRFAPKKWVARFMYNGEQREVITDYHGKGRKPREARIEVGSICGFDKLRNAPRQFRFDRIQGNVIWSREYTQGLQS